MNWKRTGARARGLLRRGAVGGAVAACMLVGAGSAFAVGGPVILGGDDLQDHGSVDTATGNLIQGWLYIEKAIGNISPKVGRANDNSIAALGSAPSTATSGDGGAAIGLAAAKNGLSVTYYDGETAIRSFFAQLQAGTVRPRIIWIAGTGTANVLADNGVGDNEFLALTENASGINDFVNSGGGLMSHGDEQAYGSAVDDRGTPADTTDDLPARPGWLTALIPDIVTVGGGGGSGDVSLTTAGNLAFPGLTDADAGAGPWHNHFRGNLGGLEILAVSKSIARDGMGNGEGGGILLPGQEPAPIILGGGQVSLTLKPADLGITKVGSPASVTQGRNVTYTMEVTNNGPNPATGVTVTDSLPAGATAISSSAGCSGTSTVTCNVGDLANGAKATVTITARMDQVGTRTNTAKVTSGVPDTNAANDQASATTTVTAPPPPPVAQVAAATTPPRARLSVTKTGPLAATAGQTATYRIRVRNLSSTAATRVRLVDVLPSGLSLAGTPMGAKFAAGRLTWTVGTLAARGSRTFTVKLRIDRTIGGQRCNTATATAANANSARDRSCMRIRAVAGQVAPPVTG